ncbi:MAG: hypothetical protein H3C31_05635 [Brumimicrobium sp.]|nr:hypothetical protein [Brumimicrobium sp.]
MDKKTKNYNILKLIIMLLFFWMITAVLLFIYKKDDSSLASLLPPDTDLVVNIKTENLIKQMFEDIIYKSDFNSDELVFLENRGNMDNIGSIGIDWRKDVVYFVKTQDNIQFQGFLFKLRDKNAFINYNHGPYYIKATNGEIGILLMTDNPANTEIYTQFAENILNNHLQKGEVFKDNHLVHVTYKGANNKYNINLHIEIKNENMFIQGEGDKIINNSQNTLYHVMDSSPSSQLLKIEFGEISDDLYQDIHAILYEIGLQLPKATTGNIQFYGVAVENIEGSATFIPQFDAILNFKDSLDIKSQIDTLVKYVPTITYSESGKLQMGNTYFYYKQLSNTEVYIGVTQAPQIKQEEVQRLFKIQGEPSVILNIEGKGLIARFINIIPQVKSSKTFLNQVEDLDFEAKPNHETISFKGKLTLKDHKLMTIEMLKLILNLVE